MPHGGCDRSHRRLGRVGHQARGGTPERVRRFHLRTTGAVVSSLGTSLVWGHPALQLVIDVPADGPVGVRTLFPGHPARDVPATQPLVEVLVAGAGRARASHRFSETAVGRRLRYAGTE